MVNAFLRGIKIKHADHPFVLMPVLLLLALTAGAGLVWSLPVAILVAILGGTLLLLAMLFHVYRLVRRDLEDQQRKTQAMLYLTQHLGLREPLPYLASWAATPELALAIHKAVRSRKPNLIVELGSGISTLICGYTLEGLSSDGRVLSFDHDVAFAELTRSHVAAHGLETYCTVVDAPLTDTVVEGQRRCWYNPDQLVLPAPIDLLIVDGPPVKSEHLARYPALPLLHQHLSDHATVVLHDTHRADETKTVKRWLQTFPEFKATQIDTEKGITILTRTL